MPNHRRHFRRVSLWTVCALAVALTYPAGAQDNETNRAPSLAAADLETTGPSDAPLLTRPDEPPPAMAPAPVETTDLAPPTPADEPADVPAVAPPVEATPEPEGENDVQSQAPAEAAPLGNAPPETASDTGEPEKASSNAVATAREPDTHPVIGAILEHLTRRRASGAKADEDFELAIASFYSAVADRPLWTNQNGFNGRAQNAMAFIRKADDWGLKAEDFALPTLPSTQPSLNQRADAEVKLSEAVLLYARHARGGRLRPRSVSRLLHHEPEFADPLTLLQELAASADSDAEQTLADLHPPHEQFHKLRAALIAARRASQSADDPSRDDKGDGPGKTHGISVHKILANMERWRWLPRDLGEFYVWDNVPTQMASVYDGAERVFHERMVVGKPSTPTPMFSDKMEYIIFHPSWGVPPGMKRNELLPQLRNSNGGWFSSKPLASSVLRAHGLRVSRGGVPVNPDTIDWSKVNIHSYQFTQPPGPTNVLGTVKFRFPNHHNIYMHDTPERHLFGKRDRTFSHGCMRIQNPIRLAEVLLAHDKGWSPDEVQRQKRRGAHITLERPIPVHIAYFTVVANADGSLDQHGDLYGIDRRLASKLSGHKVSLRGSKVSKKQVKRKKRTAYRNKRRKPVREEKKPWNPFASLHD